MNDIISIPNMNSTPDLPFEDEMHDDELEALVDDNPFFFGNTEEVPERLTDTEEEEASIQKRMKLDEEPAAFFEPVWHERIKNLKSTVSGSQLIVAKDINAQLKKIFAIFNSHQHVLDYIDRIPKEERMLYEWILPHMPAKLVFDIDCSEELVINDPL